jgi:hypothetical protein
MFWKINKKRKMEEEMKTRNRKRTLTENEAAPSSSMEDIATDVFSEIWRLPSVLHLRKIGSKRAAQLLKAWIC